MVVTANKLRASNGWHGGLVEWEEPDGRVCLSVVFSWLVERAAARAVELLRAGKTVSVGGPAAVVAGISSSGSRPGALSRHNSRATVTSTGCVEHCGFCIVPAVEGDLRELAAWEPRPIVCDNNLTACSRAHFDRVVDSLKGVEGVDFNQGLSAKRLTPHHASRLAELDMRCVRLSWDSVRYESHFMQAWQTLRSAGFPARRITVYVLIGYRDTLADALYRLQMVRNLGGLPFPMRYQPVDTERRNSFVGEGWTNHELVRYCRYWANLRITRKIPFAEFQYPSPRNGSGGIDKQSTPE